MWISKAFAADEDAIQLEALADAPSATETFLLNMGLIGVLVLMFYVLLILPQQRRFKEHANMLNKLKKGDRVVTSGGLIGRIDSVSDENGEVVLDLGNGIKVTALRSMIQNKSEPVLKSANDDKKAKAANKAEKKETAKPKSEKEKKKEK